MTGGPHTVHSRVLAAAAAQRAAKADYAAQDNRLIASRLDRIVNRYPHLNAATAIVLAENGLDEHSDEVKLVGELQVKRDSQKSLWGQFKDDLKRSVDRYAKKGTRVGLAAAGAPYEYAEGQFRNTVTAAQEGDLASVARYANPATMYLDTPGGAGDTFGQTRLGAAVEVTRESKGRIGLAAALNNNPQMGPDGDPATLLDRTQSSWTPGPNSLAEKQQVENARDAGMIGGRATTWGRTAGRLVGFQPGGVAHNLMKHALDVNRWSGDDASQEDWIRQAQAVFEGGIDAGAAIGFDPAGKLSARKAGLLAQGEAGLLARVTSRTSRETGLSRNGAFRGRTVELPAHDRLTARARPKEPPTVRRGPNGTLQTRDGKPLGDDDWVTVYHTTSAENAARLRKEGVVRANKPAGKITLVESETVAQALGKNIGDPLDYEPGRGMGKGLYVTTSKAEGQAFGDTTIPVRVQVKDLVAPPERPRLNAANSLLVGDGYVERDLPVQQIGDVPVHEMPILVSTPERDTVVFEQGEKYIRHTKHGDRLANYGAAETSYERLAHVLGRSVPPQTVLRLLGETDPARWKDAFIEEMGKGFITRRTDPGLLDRAAVGQGPLSGKFAGIGAATTRLASGRWAQLAPSETVVSRSDPAWAVEQYRRTLHTMRTGVAKDTFTPEFIDNNVEAFARGITDPDADWTAPVVAMADAAKTMLLAHGVDRGHAENLTRIWQERVASQRAFWIDPKTGTNKSAFIIDGEDHAQAAASASAEMFTDGIPLINPAEFKRAASRMAKLYTDPNWERLVGAGDALTTFFKFMVLPVRGPAWMVRNLTEAQGRIVMEGLPGMFNSPLEALAWRIADNPRSAASRALGRVERADNRAGRFLEKIDLLDDVNTTKGARVTGALNKVDDLAGKVMPRRESGEAGRGGYTAAGEDFQLRALLEDDADNYVRSREHGGGPWLDERRIYTGEYDIVNRDGGNWEQWLDGHRFNLAKLSGSPEYRMAVDAETPDHAVNLFWNSGVRKRMVAQHPELATREGAAAYMRKVEERIQDVTGGHPALREAIRRGKIDGVSLIARDARGNMAYNKAASDALAKYDTHLPDYTTVPHSVTSAERKSLFQGVARYGFELFGSRPNNRFVNSPLFRQLHWQDAVRLAPLGTPEARAELIVNARKANMPASVIRELSTDMGPAGKLDAEDIAALADTKAFDRWMDIVYNSHNKGNWTQSVRMISPFAAAVADMYRYWGKRLYKNPLVLHRVEQGMHGARQSGHVYVDENGEERFFYPLTRGMAGSMAGRGFSGTVKGANMITSSLLPGLGPVITWPVALFLPDKKETDGLRKIINPYGDPDASGGLLEGFAPGHVQRIMALLGHGSKEQERRYQESLNDTMVYLASTGNYGNSEKEQERLRNDAQAKGKILYLIQAIAQSSAPASPRAEQQFQYGDRSAKLVTVAGDYRKFLRQYPDDQGEATRQFLHKWGDAAWLAVTGSTKGQSQLTTEEAHNLARAHPELLSRYKQTWSFFTDPNSPFSFDEFHRQIAKDERQPRTLEERQVAAQTSAAWDLYYQYKDEVGPFPTAEEDDYLAYVKAEIRKDFPLWDTSFDAQKTTKQIDEAFRAAKDPALADLPVANAVRTYESARASAMQAAVDAGLVKAPGLGYGRAKATEDTRDYLRYVASQLLQETPEFKTLWDRVFSNEMVADVEGQP